LTDLDSVFSVPGELNSPTEMRSAETSQIDLSQSTPTKLKNLTATEIENLTEEESLELAMRQSMKENNLNVRRSLEMTPFGMSEDDQVNYQSNDF
jgi:hypothetical protein